MLLKHLPFALLAACLAATCLNAQQSAEAATDGAPKPDASQPYNFILFLEYSNRSKDLDGMGSGSSNGQQAIAERIVSQSDKGTEIEYFVPGDDPPGIIAWQYPARVEVAHDGSKTILNPQEVQDRLDAFLKTAAFGRDACGKWGFSWTAFQLRCDNQAIVDSIETFGMRPTEMVEGAPLSAPAAITTPLLYAAGTRNGRQLLRAEIGIDSEAVRKREAEGKVIVAQIAGETLSIEQALEELRDLTASGSIVVEFEVDEEGLVWRRSQTTIMTVKGNDFDDTDRGETRVSREVTRRFTAHEWAEWQATEGEERDWSFR